MTSETGKVSEKHVQENVREKCSEILVNILEFRKIQDFCQQNRPNILNIFLDMNFGQKLCHVQYFRKAKEAAVAKVA